MFNQFSKLIIWLLRKKKAIKFSVKIEMGCISRVDLMNLNNDYFESFACEQSKQRKLSIAMLKQLTDVCDTCSC